jgi:anti-sigma B factor antagonist
MNFALTTDERDDVTVVTVSGELDIATSAELVEALDRADGGRVLAVDLTPTEFLDSTGVRTLANAARERPDGFVVICPSSNIAVSRVFELTGFDAALTVHESLADLDSSPTER